MAFGIVSEFEVIMFGKNLASCFMFAYVASPTSRISSALECQRKGIYCILLLASNGRLGDVDSYSA
jgi:hypothetical protein